MCDNAGDGRIWLVFCGAFMVCEEEGSCVHCIIQSSSPDNSSHDWHSFLARAASSWKVNVYNNYSYVHQYGLKAFSYEVMGLIFKWLWCCSLLGSILVMVGLYILLWGKMVETQNQESEAKLFQQDEEIMGQETQIQRIIVSKD